MTRLIFCVLLSTFIPNFYISGEDYSSEISSQSDGSEDDAKYQYQSPYPDDLPPTADGQPPYSVEEINDGIKASPTSIKSPCRLPLHPGFCNGRFRAWGFDWKSKKCVPFLYNGCLGNENNFPKKKYCETKCLSGNNPKDDLGESEPTLEDFDNPNQGKLKI